MTVDSYEFCGCSIDLMSLNPIESKRSLSGWNFPLNWIFPEGPHECPLSLPNCQARPQTQIPKAQPQTQIPKAQPQPSQTQIPISSKDTGAETKILWAF